MGAYESQNQKALDCSQKLAESCPHLLWLIYHLRLRILVGDEIQIHNLYIYVFSSGFMLNSVFKVEFISLTSYNALLIFSVLILVFQKYYSW